MDDLFPEDRQMIRNHWAALFVFIFMNEEEVLISELKAFVDKHGKDEIIGQLIDVLGEEYTFNKLLEYDFNHTFENWMIRTLKVEEYLDFKGD